MSRGHSRQTLIEGFLADRNFQLWNCAHDADLILVEAEVVDLREVGAVADGRVDVPAVARIMLEVYASADRALPRMELVLLL